MAAALPALRAMRIGGPARRLSGPAFRMSRAAYAERQRASLDPGQREAFWLQALEPRAQRPWCRVTWTDATPSHAGYYKCPCVLCKYGTLTEPELNLNAKVVTWESPGEGSLENQDPVVLLWEDGITNEGSLFFH